MPTRQQYNSGLTIGMDLGNKKHEICIWESEYIPLKYKKKFKDLVA